MVVPQLLLEILENLGKADFDKFKWFLSMNVLPGCKPIPVCHLEMASRTDAVSRMIESYGEESAVNVTVEILKKMNNNDAAERLKKRYAGGNTAATSTSSSAVAPPAAPAAMLAQHGSVIIAPSVSGGTSGSWNITINK